MKYSLLAVLTVTVVVISGCRHTHSYDQIKTEPAGKGSIGEKPGSGAAELAAAPAESGSASSTLPGGINPSGVAPGTPASSPAKPPDFLDVKTLQIKGIPRYPRARMLKIQFGPMQGYDAAMMLLSSKDSFDNITAFYDAVIRDNHWSVTANDRSPGSFFWNLSDGQGSEGLIRINKDAKTNVVTVVLDRVRKLPESKEPDK